MLIGNIKTIYCIYIVSCFNNDVNWTNIYKSKCLFLNIQHVLLQQGCEYLKTCDISSLCLHTLLISCDWSLSSILSLSPSLPPSPCEQHSASPYLSQAVALKRGRENRSFIEVSCRSMQVLLRCIRSMYIIRWRSIRLNWGWPHLVHLILHMSVGWFLFDHLKKSLFLKK